MSTRPNPSPGFDPSLPDDRPTQTDISDDFGQSLSALRDAAGDGPWLHIYPQGHEHGPARIMGTRLALIGLREAIDQALIQNRDGEAEGMTADGEGYPVRVTIRNHKFLDQEPLPYARLTHPPHGSVPCPLCQQQIDPAKLPRENLFDAVKIRPAHRLMLTVLLKHFGRWVTRETIKTAMWGDTSDGPPLHADKIIDIAAHFLNKKLPALGYKIENSKARWDYDIVGSRRLVKIIDGGAG